MEKRCAGSITVPEDGGSKDDLRPGVSLSQKVRRRNPSFCCQGMWARYLGRLVLHLTVEGKGSVSECHINQPLSGSGSSGPL